MAHKHHRNSRDDKSKNTRTRVDKDSKFDKKREDEKPKFSEKKFNNSGERPFDKKRNDKSYRDKEDKPFKKSFEKNSFKEDKRKSFKDHDDKPFKKSGFGKDSPRDDKRKSFQKSDDRPFKKSGFNHDNFKEGRKTSFKDKDDNKSFRKSDFEKENFRDGKIYVKRGRKEKPLASTSFSNDDTIRLNRYISNSGICSRRKADELIEAGVISVNGEVISELGFKVNPAKDQVKYNGELLKREKKVYVLLNKPKDYITTTDDPQERRTVMQLVSKASKERIYPVGRLDRNTTGLLLMTNDGDLADKLSHPKHKVTKIYQVELNRNLTQGDLNKISFGVDLEDGFIKPDTVSYVTGGSKKEIGIQIHSGKNRIVRRIFEHLGYDVVKLDRVVYANLTKKDLPRGKWRFLQEHELIQLKHLL